MNVEFTRNDFANLDTMFIANAIFKTESLLVAAKRLTNRFALKNLVWDAVDAGMIGDDIEIENVEFDEILDKLEA